MLFKNREDVVAFLIYWSLYEIVFLHARSFIFWKRALDP